MNNINISSAQYVLNETTNENTSIRIVVDSEELYVPLDPANRHYQEIMRQVEAGELTIQEAE